VILVNLFFRDLKALQRFTLGHWVCESAAGVRYAKICQTYGAYNTHIDRQNFQENDNDNLGLLGGRLAAGINF
jgi:hypothetical protein